MQARLSCSAHRRFRRAGHTLRDFNDNYQYGNLLFQQPVGGVSTGFLENSPSTHYYWLPTPQGDILVGFDQGINSYAVYTDHLGTPRLLTKIDNPQNPKPITDTSNDLPLADYGQPEGISPMAIPVWQWSYSPFGADLANGYEARPTTIKNNFKPDLWAWMGLPETGGADPNQVAQETWRIEQNLHIQPVLNIRYPGQYYDFESGLVQNWWRTYEPKIGRYTSADPIGLNGGWNRFAYVAGDGVNYIDPNGLWPKGAGRPLGGYNPNDVRGGFRPDGTSSVYHPDNYDPDTAAAILITSAFSIGTEAISSLSMCSRLAAKEGLFGARTAPELQEIYQWGRGASGAQKAREGLSVADMARIKAAETKGRVQAGKRMYEAAQREGKGGQTAIERAQYLEEILRRWGR